MGEHSKSSILRFSRKYLGMTQEEVADNICDPVSMSRYESGKVEPSDKNFYLMMEKMGLSGERYFIPVSTEIQEQLEKKEKIKILLEQRKFDDVEKVLSELRMDLDSVENRQFFERVLTIVNFEKGKIPLKKYVENIMKAICISMEDFKGYHFNVYRVFSENEILLINELSIAYWLQGKKEAAIKLLENMEEYYKREIVIADYKPRYIILLNLSSMLGQMGEYEKSIAISKQGISWLNKKKKANCMYNFYFNIGWNYYQLSKKEDEAEKKQTAKMYVWLSYTLCNLFSEAEDNKKQLLNFWKENLM